MIQRKKKICKGCNTPQYLFSHGLCKSCWSKEQYIKNKASNSPVQPLSRKSGYKIPLRSKKRSEQEKEYYNIIEVWKKKVANTPCFFCGEKLGSPESIDMHHLDGRENDNLTDIKNLVPVHRECHMQYHYTSVHDIPWFLDYVNRLSDKNVELAEREMFKFDK